MSQLIRLIRHARFITLISMFTLSLCFTTVVVRATPAPQKATEADFAAIEAYIETQMHDLRIPGLALGIVQGDQIVYLKGYGIADPAGRAVMPQTPFNIGSTTKSFTALAILQLVEAGKIELDAPVQRYLPWFRVADAATAAQIMVRHLLNQTSGFATGTGRRIPDPNVDMEVDGLEQIVRGLSTVQLSQPMGEGFQYSNANYWILGMIVQTVTGQSYAEYIQQHIFTPLAMHHAYTAKADAPDLATGYRYWFGWPIAADLPDNRAERPAGHLMASAEDLAHYLIAQVNDGRYADGSILSPDGIAEMHRPALGDAGYGMGWISETVNDLPAVWHNGSNPNFHADLLLIPKGGWGIVLLANAESLLQNGPLTGIAFGVASLVTGRQPQLVTTDPFLLGLYGVALGLTALAVFGIARSLLTWRRWQTRLVQTPGWRGQFVRVIFPLLLNLLLALILLVGLPWLFKAPLLGLTYVFPDLGYTLVVGGGVTLGWGVVRTVLAYLALRAGSTPTKSLVGAPVSGSLKA
jgi:CubicO group peptidase (beta-lactamase class C family)